MNVQCVSRPHALRRNGSISTIIGTVSAAQSQLRARRTSFDDRVAKADCCGTRLRRVHPAQLLMSMLEILYKLVAGSDAATRSMAL